MTRYFLMSLAVAAALLPAVVFAETIDGLPGVSIDPNTGAVTIPGLTVFGAQSLPSVANPNLCLTALDANGTAGSAVGMTTCGTSPAQTWVTAGMTLQVLDKCLDVGNAAQGNTSLPLVIQPCVAGKATQSWSPALQNNQKGTQYQLGGGGVCLTSAAQAGTQATAAACGASQALWSPQSTAPQGFTCSAQVTSNGTWVSGNSNNGAFNVQIQQTGGSAPLPVPYTVEVDDTAYGAPSQWWNVSVVSPSSSGSLMGTLEQSWQTLTPGSGGVQFGYVVPFSSGTSASSAPQSIEVDGIICTLQHQ